MIKHIIIKILSWIVLTRLSKLLVLTVIKLTFFYQKTDIYESKKTLLILNHERFKHDLKSLSLDSRVKLLILPSRIQTLVNTLFLDKDQSYQINSYVDPKPEVERLINFILSILLALHKKYDLCGILTCSFYYRQDLPYQFASLKTNIPFYVLFKEFLKDDCTINQSIERYHQNKFKFYGEKIFSANSNIQKILINAKVCKENQISIVGSPRFDGIVKNTKVTTRKKQKIVTLFSFFHASGGLLVNDDPIEGNFFTDDKDLGFYNLFEQVHVAIAELAVANPDILYNIKTKWAGPWYERIISTIYRNSGIDILKQPNLILDYQESAQSLIERSSVIVAFNSTTVLEASLMNRNVILPIFCEAKTKYLDTNVIYRKYLDSLITASSKEDLKDKIEVFINEEVYNKVPDQMVRKFIHTNEGNSGKRIVDEILQKDEP